QPPLRPRGQPRLRPAVSIAERRFGSVLSDESPRLRSRAQLRLLPPARADNYTKSMTCVNGQVLAGGRSLLRRRHARGGNFTRCKDVGRAAELACHRDAAVLDHIGAILRRETEQHVFDAVTRTRALRGHRRRAKDANAALVKQAIGQTLARQFWIEQLDIVNG